MMTGLGVGDDSDVGDGTAAEDAAGDSGRDAGGTGEAREELCETNGEIPALHPQRINDMRRVTAFHILRLIYIAAASFQLEILSFFHIIYLISHEVKKTRFMGINVSYISYITTDSNLASPSIMIHFQFPVMSTILPYL
jgi:hypothetical protein